MQREQLCGLSRRWQRPVAVLDKGLSVVRFIRSHPLLLAPVGAVAAYLVTRRLGGSRKLVGGLLGAWQTARSVRSWWSK